MSDHDWLLLRDEAGRDPDLSEYDGPPCEWCEGDSANCDCHTFICADCGEVHQRANPPHEVETRCPECISLNAIAEQEQCDPHERNGGRIP
jgi:phage FluMu protein Com